MKEHLDAIKSEFEAKESELDEVKRAISDRDYQIKQLTNELAKTKTDLEAHQRRFNKLSETIKEVGADE